MYTDIIEMERIGQLDLKFQLQWRDGGQIWGTTHTVSNPGSYNLSKLKGGSWFALVVEIKFRAGTWVNQTLNLDLTEDVAEYIAKNWPTNTTQLMTILLLAGAHDKWQELENAILKRIYPSGSFNSNEGTYVKVF